jgi:hypothetical protein
MFYDPLKKHILSKNVQVGSGSIILDNRFADPEHMSSKCFHIAYSGLGTAMAKELPDLLHSFTAEEWIGTNITPKLRHTERTHGFLLYHLWKADVLIEGLTAMGLCN